MAGKHPTNSGRYVLYLFPNRTFTTGRYVGRVDEDFQRSTLRGTRTFTSPPSLPCQLEEIGEMDTWSGWEALPISPHPPNNGIYLPANLIIPPTTKMAARNLTIPSRNLTIPIRNFTLRIVGVNLEAC